MVTRSSRKRNKVEAPINSSRGKGDLVEQIVASMHEGLNVNVERNVFLKSTDGSERTREIDVLISTFIVGYQVYIPIECKNEIKPIGVGKIDEFIGKLQDVGIPIQLGVFVSASGFTKGAISRANDAGIKPLVLKGVNDNLQRELLKAFQSVVFLLLSITNISIKNNIGGNVQSHEILFFMDKNGKNCGSIPDLVWIEWVNGRVLEDLGGQNLKLELPKGWFQIINGNVANVSEISVDVLITGHVITFPGQMRRNELINVVSNKVEKIKIETNFDRQEVTLEVKSFTSNVELESFFEQMEANIKLIVGKFRLPRIKWLSLYWPLSKSTVKKLHDLKLHSIKEKTEFDITKLEIEDIEGTDLKKIWDPIIENYPATKLLKNKHIHEQD